jgi:hypothetical protein
VVAFKLSASASKSACYAAIIIIEVDESSLRVYDERDQLIMTVPVLAARTSTDTKA